MIKKLELKNFENHEHSVFEFSEGFNCIIGDGDAGKTSVVRALKLVGFNDWDPDSLRIGCKNCEVAVTTELGTVKVTRGKDNTWEVTPVGGTTQTFEKIGSKILPQASDVIGFKPVKLGDSEMNINIMDQLEKHFMMAELDGKKASGSVRAQIIDEISGLAGMEGIIKDVSLDNTRDAKEIKKQEQSIKETEENKHDEKELEQESDLLEKAENLLNNTNKQIIQIDTAEQLIDDTERIDGLIEKIKKDIASIPNTKRLSAMAENIAKICEKIFGMNDIIIQHEDSLELMGKCKRQLERCTNELDSANQEHNEILSSFTVCPVTRKPITKECSLFVEEKK